MDRAMVWKLAEAETHEHRLQATGVHAETLNQASSQLPGGVYTTFRTFPGRRILPLEDHINRLERSAELVGLPNTLDSKALRWALHKVIPDEPVWVRISLDLEQSPGTVYLVIAPLLLPGAHEYAHGALSVCLQLERENPEAKQTAFIAVAEAYRQVLPEGVNEGLIIDSEGWILEGLSSNFYGVLGGEVWTAQERVLPGITRAILLQAAHEEGIHVRLQAVHRSQLPELDEAFITSSSRSVLPLRQIDQQVIGEPGTVTRRLMGAYQASIDARLEPA